MIDKVINQIRENYSWGYSVEYYLSAKCHCTPSYAGYFYKKHMLSIGQIAELLEKIDEEKKVSFDKKYADYLYFSYNAKKVDDTTTLSFLKEKISGNQILLIAPGRSVLTYQEKIEYMNAQKNMVSISVNNLSVIKTDFIFVTKQSVWEEVENCNCKFLVSSNVNTKEKKVMALNYANWANWKGTHLDNSLIMLMNLLMAIDVKKVYLAGFDGFLSNSKENYYDENLRRFVNLNQAQDRNRVIKEYLNSIKNRINIEFITPSLYEERG